MTRRMTIPSLAVATALTGSLALAQTALAQTSEGDMSDQAMVDATGATYTNDTVVFRNVVAREDGYLVVTAERPEGAPAQEPAAIGYAEVTAGTTDEITVDLDVPLEAEMIYNAQLFVDSNESGEFEWGQDITTDDQPAMNDDEPVMTSFQIIRQSGDVEEADDQM